MADDDGERANGLREYGGVSNYRPVTCHWSSPLNEETPSKETRSDALRESLPTCGYIDDRVKERTCAPARVTCIQKRTSGLLLDGIDLHPEVLRAKHERLPGDRPGEPSATIGALAEAAHERRARRS